MVIVSTSADHRGRHRAQDFHGGIRSAADGSRHELIIEGFVDGDRGDR
jgi:hypothetical protein